MVKALRKYDRGEWRGCLGIATWAHLNHQNPPSRKRKAEGLDSEGLRDVALLAVNTEQGATSKKGSRLLETAKGKGTDCPREQKRSSPFDVEPTLDSDFIYVRE